MNIYVFPAEIEDCTITQEPPYIPAPAYDGIYDSTGYQEGNYAYEHTGTY